MNAQILEEASDWIVRHREGNLDTTARQAFDGWLRESPHHVRAYLEMSALWEDVSSLSPSWNPGAEELIARARADQNIVSLQPPAAVTEPGEAVSVGDVHSDAVPATPARRATLLRSRLVSLHHLAWAASLLIAVAGLMFWLQLNEGIYTTEVGEQRSIALVDGSTVALNSYSRVRVRFTENERAVDLLQGQALFQVAKDRTRPFIVYSDATRVTAVGTQFDVYRKSIGTVVTVLEGRVAVLREAEATEERLTPGAGTLPTAPRSPNILLSAGEQVTVQPGLAPLPKVANLSTATAWTQRRLVFESSPLTEVAEEFNRYNTRQLIVRDPELVHFHVSGVFSSADPDLLLRFLRAQPEIVVDETDQEIRISKR
jgi:transmembrane sensor